MSGPDGRTLAGDRHKRPSKGERQRQAIVDALAALVTEVPINELTVGQIAERAGCSRQVFYIYFDNKYSVLAAALAEATRELDESMFAPAVWDRQQRFDAYMLGLLTQAAVVNAHHLPVLGACVQAMKQDEQLREMLVQLLDGYVDKTTMLLPPELAEIPGTPQAEQQALTIRLLIVMTVLTGQHRELVTQKSDELGPAIEAIARIWSSALLRPDPDTR